MPRSGQNPLKWTPIGESPERVTVVTVVFIPELAGFWEESLDVFKLCLNSLRKNTRHPFDLMVLDNGSCAQVREYLLKGKQSGEIQFLILSEYNLRKLGAVNILLASAPGEIISFTDSDVYFLPGWLDATLKVLDAFPQAGQVTAFPSADKTTDNIESTHKAIHQDQTLKVETGDYLIPDIYIEAHRVSIGKTITQYYQQITDRKDIRISRKGVSAYVSAQDFQFTTRKEIVHKVLPLEVSVPEEYYDPIYSPVFETRLDELGYWRLSTTDYLIHHIGNRMPEISDSSDWIFTGENAGMLASTNYPSAGKFHSMYRRLIQSRLSRRILKRVNAISYNLLYDK